MNIDNKITLIISNTRNGIKRGIEDLMNRLKELEENESKNRIEPKDIKNLEFFIRERCTRIEGNTKCEGIYCKELFERYIKYCAILNYSQVEDIKLSNKTFGKMMAEIIKSDVGKSLGIKYNRKTKGVYYKGIILSDMVNDDDDYDNEYEEYKKGEDNCISSENSVKRMKSTIIPVLPQIIKPNIALRKPTTM